MNTRIIVGPLLGFEEGDYYTVCVLLEPGLAPTLRLPGSGANHAFTKTATVGKDEFWRVEFQVAPQAAGAQVGYTVEVNGVAIEDEHGRADWRFYVPGAAEQPSIAYVSCNGFSSAKLARDTDQPYLLWERMRDLHLGTPGVPAAPFSLLLMGGDQVYADEIWESKRCPTLKNWSALNWKKQHAAKVTVTMAREITAFYDWLYTDRWRDEAMSLMLASVPSIMMWDDHDIFDGWGSYPPERQGCPVFQEIFSHASRVFDVFQLRCSPRNRLNAAAQHRTLTVRFRDYHLLVLDNRSERTLTEIMSATNWNNLKAWLEGPAGQAIKNLFVMTAVPVVYRSFATVEAIIDNTPWHEEIEDDVHDHWSARPHAAERMRLVMVLFNFLQAHPACKAVLLSGDVHVGALGQLWYEPQRLSITQVIASGVVHPAPTTFEWAGIQLMTSDAPEALGDGDVVAEMLTPFGAPRYLRTRNFATFRIGTDLKIWVNWECENTKWKPSFAIA